MRATKRFQLFFGRWPDVHIYSAQEDLVELFLASTAAQNFPGLPANPVLRLPGAQAETILSTMEAQGLDVFAWG